MRCAEAMPYWRELRGVGSFEPRWRELGGAGFTGCCLGLEFLQCRVAGIAVSVDLEDTIGRWYL
jgi:hypothetical protein